MIPDDESDEFVAFVLIGLIGLLLTAFAVIAGCVATEIP